MFPADLAGCGHQRMVYPAEALRALGHDVKVFKPGEQDNFPIAIYQRGHVREVKLLAESIDADVVVIQRPMHWMWQHVIPQMQALGVRVVADLDDDISALHHAHAMRDGVDPVMSPDVNWRHLLKAMLKADAVTVSTPALAERYGRRNTVTVIPNCIPSHYLGLRVKRDPTRLVVGWSGSVASHPGDLNVLGHSLVEVARGTPFEWRVVGSGLGVKAAMGLPPNVVDYVPVGKFAKQVARFDVGVVPLAVTRFNQAKSWLKGLEMASVGVPFVASPTDSYKAFTALGAGVLADKPKVWAWQVRRLLTDPVLRSEMADAGREVAAQWTFDANAWRWEEAWCPN